MSEAPRMSGTARRKGEKKSDRVNELARSWREVAKNKDLLINQTL